MDIINITDKDNNIVQMEVVSTFKLDNKEYTYLIYRELDGSKVYIAKYKDNIEELDTNLDEFELKMCENIMNEVVR